MLQERANTSEAENRVAMGRFYRSYLAIRQVRVPTIAVLHGAAMGAGLCFAMSCDLRLAAAGTKLGVDFVRVGLHPGMGATWLLPRLVGPSRATELLLTGRTVVAEEAAAMGLVHQVHSEAALEGAVRALADEIVSAAPSRSHRPRPRSSARSTGRSMSRSMRRRVHRPSISAPPI